MRRLSWRDLPIILEVVFPVIVLGAWVALWATIKDFSLEHKIGVTLAAAGVSMIFPYLVSFPFLARVMNIPVQTNADGKVTFEQEAWNALLRALVLVAATFVLAGFIAGITFLVSATQKGNFSYIITVILGGLSYGIALMLRLKILR